MKNLLQIGSGIFIFLSAASIYNLVKTILLDILLILRINHQLNFWITNLISILIFFISFLLLIKWFNKRIKSVYDKKILLQLFVTYVFTQLLQFLYGMFITDYLMDNFGDNYKIHYYEAMTSSSFYLTFGTFFIFSCHISIFIYLYLKIKKNTDL